MIVVGGGVIGLTTAVVLAESGRRVRIWAREPAERTTSAVAGGLWWPYRIEPEELAGEWALASLPCTRSWRPGPTRRAYAWSRVYRAGALDELGAWAAAGGRAAGGDARGVPRASGCGRGCR